MEESVNFSSFFRHQLPLCGLVWAIDSNQINPKNINIYPTIEKLGMNEQILTTPRAFATAPPMEISELEASPTRARFAGLMTTTNTTSSSSSSRSYHYSSPPGYYQESSSVLVPTGRNDSVSWGGNDSELAKSGCFMYFGLPFRLRSWSNLVYFTLISLIRSVLICTWLAVSSAAMLVWLVAVPPIGMAVCVLISSSWKIITENELNSLYKRFISTNSRYQFDYMLRDSSSKYGGDALADVNSDVIHPRTNSRSISIDLGDQACLWNNVESLAARAKHNFSNETSRAWVLAFYAPFIKLPLSVVSCVLCLGSLAISVFGLLNWVLVFVCFDKCYSWLPNSSADGDGDFGWLKQLFEPGAITLLGIPFGIIFLFLTFMFVEFFCKIHYKIAKHMLFVGYSR